MIVLLSFFIIHVHPAQPSRVVYKSKDSSGLDRLNNLSNLLSNAIRMRTQPNDRDE